MCYLQSRYYNPEFGRFINADAIVGQTGELLSHNMFMYSQNNPVNMSDPSGFMPIFDLGDDYNFTPRFIKKYSEEILDSIEEGVRNGIKNALKETFGSPSGNFVTGGSTAWQTLSEGYKKKGQLNERLKIMKTKENLYSPERLKAYELSINSKARFAGVKGGAKGGVYGILMSFGLHSVWGFGNGFAKTFERDLKVRELIESQHVWDRS